MASQRVFYSNPNQDGVNKLISKLRALLPPQRSNQRVPSSEILKETCDYIRRQQKEVEELAGRIVPTLENENALEAHDIQVLIRNILHQ